jgi:putative aminopeptidase FrvX
MMDYTEYAMQLTKELLQTPSPGGYTFKQRELCKKRFEDMGLEVRRTKKGAVYAVLPGKNKDKARTVAAHIDTLGAIVKEIKDDGYLRITNIGGYAWQSVEGENLTIHTREEKEITGTLLPDKASIHVFSDEVREAERTEDSVQVRLDADVSSKEDVLKLGINVGDFVSFDPRTVITENGYIKSRYLDDMACVGVLYAAAKQILDEKREVPYTTYLFLTDYEEIGHGLYGVPDDCHEILALDIGTVGSYHTSCEKKVTILAKDSRTPYDYEFRHRLEEIAIKNKIDYATDVHFRYGSDATTYALQGTDFNFACIGLGVNATHHYERSHYDGYKNNIDLLREYILSEY